MPTHQGKSQTDIVVGDAGESAATVALELLADTTGSVAVRSQEESGPLTQDGSHSWTFRDAAGAILATVAVAQHVSATPDAGLAASRSRTDAWDAVEKGAVTWPTAGATASRDWWAEVPGVGAYQASLEVVCSPSSGVVATTNVSEQTPDRLVLVLTLTAGRSTVGSLSIAFDTALTGEPASPLVDDQLGL